MNLSKWKTEEQGIQFPFLNDKKIRRRKLRLRKGEKTFRASRLNTCFVSHLPTSSLLS